MSILGGARTVCRRLSRRSGRPQSGRSTCREARRRRRRQLAACTDDSPGRSDRGRLEFNPSCSRCARTAVVPTWYRAVDNSSLHQKKGKHVRTRNLPLLELRGSGCGPGGRGFKSRRSPLVGPGISMDGASPRASASVLSCAGSHHPAPAREPRRVARFRSATVRTFARCMSKRCSASVRSSRVSLSSRRGPRDAGERGEIRGDRGGHHVEHRDVDDDDQQRDGQDGQHDPSVGRGSSWSIRVSPPSGGRRSPCPSSGACGRRGRPRRRAHRRTGCRCASPRAAARPPA